MKRKPMLILGVIVGVLLVLQLVPVDRTNPPVTADLEAPAQAKEILKRGCYDCHSNETEWRWYSYVAPLSWMVAGEVAEGRGRLNFSLWQQLEPAGQLHVAEGVWRSIDRGYMPPRNYLVTHPEARLSEADRDAIRLWRDSVMSAVGSDVPQVQQGHEGHDHGDD